MRVKFIAGWILFMAMPVSAHSLFMDCEQQETDVKCLASFSDGSSVANMPYEVISYNDKLLYSGRTDEASIFKFALPQTDYFILLDAGPGHVVEVDMADVAAE
ncbi:hypothetical protein ACMXYV_16940 [Neptuniibacter sp. SY11_33]|uniref:hypothetical protein n=1 Tax=Neptuniibacter sp. SY11_33 TaxID=3398215 RepID=UPI0039F638F6